MAFYTSVELIRNKICYRGYNDNGVATQVKYDFEPTLFRPAKTETGWKNIHGHNVEPFTLSSPSALWNWLKDHEDVGGFKYYGSEKPVMQFIRKKFPDDIKFNPKWINIVNFDIEVHSTDGFPDADKAEHPVVSITAKSSRNETYFAWGLKDYDSKKSPHKHLTIVYRKCKNEEDLLRSFLEWWTKDYPDAVTGWYIRFFDIPYLINRFNRLGFDEAVNRFSPWGVIKQKSISFKNKNMDSYQIAGISQVDYHDLFTKFGIYQYGPQESYTLNHISYIVLNETKLSYEEHGSLKDLYENDPQLHLDYNIKDVELVDRIDEKMNLLTLAFTISYMAGTNVSEVFGTTSMWDSIVYRELSKNNIAIPAMKHRGSIANMKSSFTGGYVKEVDPGLYNNVVSFDLASLYPLIIAMLNMSPEKLVNDFSLNNSDPEYYLDNDPNPSGNYSISANGQLFSNDERGVFPTIIKKFYARRRAAKDEQLISEKEYEKTKDKKLESTISTLLNEQMAIKILMNSLFGAMGNKWYRYFDLRIAEGITLTGQFVIKWCERTINQEMNKILGTDGIDYVIAIDTDSLYVNMDAIVKKFDPVDPVDFLDKICADHFNPMFKKSMEKLSKRMNVFEPLMEMEREIIADRGIFQAKKRYILNVWDKEGVRYKSPKLKIMGIEAIKSSTPEKCRSWMIELFTILMTGTEKEIQEYIKNRREEFSGLAPHEISFPRGVTSVDNYLRNGNFISGTPINSKAAINYNLLLEKFNLENKYEKIKNGSKIKYSYLKTPNPYGMTVIAFPDYLPKEFKLEEYLYTEKQFQKSFLDPCNSILDVIGWSAKPQSKLTDFFM